MKDFLIELDSAAHAHADLYAHGECAKMADYAAFQAGAIWFKKHYYKPSISSDRQLSLNFN